MCVCVMCVYTCRYVSMHECACGCDVCVCVWRCVCVRVRVYVHVCVCMRVHNNIRVRNTLGATSLNTQQKALLCEEL